MRAVPRISEENACFLIILAPFVVKTAISKSGEQNDCQRLRRAEASDRAQGHCDVLASAFDADGLELYNRTGCCFPLAVASFIFLGVVMSSSRSSFAVSRLVNRHLSALVTEARSAGMQLEDLTIELAAHANCAALSFWSADDLHSLLEAAAAEASPQAVAEWKHIEPMGRA